MTRQAQLVVGLLNPSLQIPDDQVAAKLRELSIAWTRYGYQGEIIERGSVEELLETALAAGYQYCMVLPVGFVLFERWHADSSASRDFFTSLATWLQQTPVALAGSVAMDDATWVQFITSCLLVDVQRYGAWGHPELGPCDLQVTDVPVVQYDGQTPESCQLTSTGDTESRQVGGWGWNLIRHCLAAGQPVHEFPPSVTNFLLRLDNPELQEDSAFASYLGKGIDAFACDARGECELTRDQQLFLRTISAQTANARHGVFLWNIESYDDIETPPADFHAPLTSLYSVAAGFKPVRILFTHGTQESTRMVYYDYSQSALDVRRCLVDEWNGEHFPEFVRYLFQRFPAPNTYYQLWDNVTPATVDWADIDAMWQRELQRWGGPEAFRDFWQVYRQLPHEYILCNIMQDPSALLSALRDEDNAVIWWSNAFFTMYGNWYYDAPARETAYRHWISQLADRCPRLFFLGSDGNNTNVNGIRAAEYLDVYEECGCDSLVPLHVGGTVVRM